MIKDVEFLRKNGLMDYSLLLAIERRPQILESLNSIDVSESKVFASKEGAFTDCVRMLICQAHIYQSKRRTYHMAIIDYLQAWTVNKKLERFSKTTFLGKNGA